jgi:hypothetical protein
MSGSAQVEEAPYHFPNPTVLEGPDLRDAMNLQKQLRAFFNGIGDNSIADIDVEVHWEPNETDAVSRWYGLVARVNDLNLSDDELADRATVIGGMPLTFERRVLNRDELRPPQPEPAPRFPASAELDGPDLHKAINVQKALLEDASSGVMRGVTGVDVVVVNGTNGNVPTRHFELVARVDNLKVSDETLKKRGTTVEGVPVSYRRRPLTRKEIKAAQGKSPTA